LKLLENRKILIPSIVIPKPIRYLAKTLELISSRLSSLFGLMLFVTPIKYPIPKREQYMLKSAQKKRLFINSINKEIEILSYGYSRKKVLLVHGWCGRSTQLYAFADKLLENGYMVISFDGPAHGRSSGKTTMMPEFLETIKNINTTYGPFEAAIGHSFGATSLYIATSEFLTIKSLVAIGSGDKISDIILNFSKNLNLKKKSAQLIQSRLEKKWKINVDDSSSSTVAKKINIPVLVIHDKTDGDVPVNCAYEIRKNLKKGSLLITNKLGHTKILRNEEIVMKSINFIQQNS
jgi:pimeloyl-ACP methyl ester carboxylesterase